MNWGGLRKASGLSQQELAKLAGVSQSFIAKLEAGKLDPAYSRVLRLEQALKVHSLTDSDWLAGHLGDVPAFVWGSQSIQSAIVELESRHIFALPVKNELGLVTGLFHLQPLLDDLYFEQNVGQKKVVSDVMISPQILSLNAPKQSVLALLRERGVVLIGNSAELKGWVLPFGVVKSDYGSKVRI